MTKIPHNPDEIIAVVDDKDKIIRGATRKEVHKGLLHREVYVYLINSKNKVLLQKRKDRHIWDHSSAGHFPKDQDYKEAAQREFEEELGIRLDSKEFIEIGKEKLRESWEDLTNYRFAKIFVVRKDIPIENFKIDYGEVEEIKYFNKEELEQLLKNPEVITSSAEMIIRKYILKLLNNY